ncbi:PorP/SprF family type IX secretion system membrane protein [Cytophagaceae bacterium ABcell3]|nr:PorP/SprF family type IX secretion system membrane protein [Cytophagaceae bacterium ABcell3]
MLKNTLFLLFLKLWLINHYGHAQHFSDYADKFNLFYKNYPLINPASIGANTNLGIHSGYRTLTGVFSQVNTYYTSANANVNVSENGQKHVLGLTLFGDKEGEYFRRSRSYLNYAFHLELSENTFISAGTSLGFVSYNYRSSTAGVSGSDISFTGNTGLWLYGDNFHFGASINDFPNATLRPIDEETTLFRHYLFTGDYTFTLNHQLKIMPMAAITLASQNYYSINSGLVFIMQDKLSAGTMYRLHQGYVFLVGLEDIDLFSGNFNLTFSYMVSQAQSVNIPANTIELALNFLIAK